MVFIDQLGTGKTCVIKWIKNLASKFLIHSIKNHDKDPSLTGLNVILLPKGETRLGSGPNNVIMLKGGLMSDNHAIIKNDSAEHSVEPLGDALIVVNGDRINQKHFFENGDRIIFGQNHFFVFRGPNCPMDQNIINFDEMNHEYLEKQKMEHRFGSFWRCYTFTIVVRSF